MKKLIVLLMGVLSILAAVGGGNPEKIAGAFGIRLGESIPPKMLISKATNGLIVVADFKAEPKYEWFNSYACITGLDGLVVFIRADRAYKEQSEAKQAYTSVASILTGKYGKPDESSFPTKSAWKADGNEIELSLQASIKRMGYELVLNYSATELVNQLSAKQQAAETEKVDKSGL